MALEATVICLDNSEWARNGDYTPNRWEAQQDAANIIAGTKTQSNPGNAVGIVSMAGTRVEVMASPTNDIAQILSAVHSSTLNGKSDLYSALQIAQLALKHRPNKDQMQRIVAFVCSPVEADEEKLSRLGRILKRNNIALDLVCFGNMDDISKLQELLRQVNSNDNSHLVSIPPGTGILSDSLLNTPIIHGYAQPESGGFDEYGGIDPNLDPEYAQAIRLSLEEARKQQEEQGAQEQPAEPQEEDEEKLLQEAIQLSMQEAQTTTQQSGEEGGQKFEDESFVTNLLKDLPGVNVDDPQIQAALKKKQEEEQKKQEEEKKD